MTLLHYTYNKNKSTQIGLARMFIVWEVETRLPTIDKLEDFFDVARGTIQLSLKKLIDEDAIVAESRGSAGTFLIAKDMHKLIECADIPFLLGSLPIPDYLLSKGMATALLSVLSNKFGIDVNITYVRSAEERIEMLNNRRFDFSIVSKRTALQMIERGSPITIAADFGEKTLYSGFKLVYGSDQAYKKGFWQNMRVGVSSFSKEQYWRSREIFDKYDPIYVDVPYDHLYEAVLNNQVDAIFRATDLIEAQLQDLPMVEVDDMQETSNAVLVVSEARKDILYLIQKIIDIPLSKTIQKQVIDGKIIAQY